MPKKPAPRRRGDDPTSVVLDDLEHPHPDRASRTAGSARRTAPPPDFPECPPERSERTWRLVRLFVETGEAYGRTRVISPWQLGKDLAVKINHDRAILSFIWANGQDLAEDILGRMVKIYWQHYVDDGMSRTAIVNQYLDDYWEDLWDQAKTEYATDEIQRLDAAGQLKVMPKTHWHSLANDTDYQAALQDLAVMEKLQESSAAVVRPVESQGPDRQS